MLIYQEIGYEERAEFYDKELDLANFYIFSQYLSREKGSIILDIPCGTGERLTYLADKNKYLILVDKEKEMVHKAQEKIARLALDNCCAIQGSIEQDLDIGLHEVDVTLLLNYAIQFFSEDKIIRIFQNLSKKSKKLFVEVKDYAKDVNFQEGYYFQEEEAFMNKGEELKKIRRYWLKNNEVYINYLYLNNQYVKEMKMHLYNYSYERMAVLVKEANLKIVNAFSDYDLSEYTSNECRMILELEKQ